tara:strand:+ start:103 stop:369 length:267 start_codon:yes stop_codon:yes gene_type:complete
MTLGQFDLRDGYVENNYMLEHLKWDGVDAFLSSDPSIWTVEGATAGYVRESTTLTQAMVIGAGHLCPKDQPKNMLDLLTRFVRGQSWS